MVDQRGTVPIHATDTDQARGSWLGRAVNPLQRLLRFHSDLQRRRQEDEDQRLAQLAAAIVVSPQARVFPPNGITVTMIGCGRMGGDIVGELLRRGCTVRAYDTTQYTRERALQLIAATLHKHNELGLQLPHDDFYMLERFTVHSTIDDAVRGASLVLEAITEDLDAKVNAFRKVTQALARQGVAPTDVLLASNTVSIPVNVLVNGLAQHAQFILVYPTRLEDGPGELGRHHDYVHLVQPLVPTIWQAVCMVSMVCVVSMVSMVCMVSVVSVVSVVSMVSARYPMLVK